MARIAGVNIPNQKRVPIGLTYIHGIGRTKAARDLRQGRHPAERRVNELTDDEVLRIRELIDREYTVEGDLRREVAMNIKRLMDLGCYRGLRHRKGPAGARPAHPHQRPHPQGPGAADRRQEEGDEVARSTDAAQRRNGSWRRAAAAPRLRRRERKNITSGVAHVNATFNNTMITITDAQGNTIAWSSSGSQGFKGSRKSTPYAAQVAAEDAGQKAMEHGMRTLEIEVKGPGSGRESRCARLQAVGFADHLDPRRDADPAQRLPPAQAPPRLSRSADPTRANVSADARRNMDFAAGVIGRPAMPIG